MYKSVIYGIGTSRWLKIETNNSIMDIGRDYILYKSIISMKKKL
jgi:hypothetical protein